MIYNVPLNISNDELLLCLKKIRLSLSNDLKPNHLILKRMSLLLIQKQFCFISAVQNCQILFQLVTWVLLKNSTFHSQFVVSNAVVFETIFGTSVIYSNMIWPYCCNLQKCHIAVNYRSVTCGGEHNANLLMLHFLNVLTAVAVTVLPTKIVLVTNEKRKFLQLELLINYLMLEHVNS